MSTKKSLLKAAYEFEESAKNYRALAAMFPDKGGAALWHAMPKMAIFEPTDEKALFLRDHLGDGWQPGTHPILATKYVCGLTVMIQRHVPSTQHAVDKTGT
jgi:hypothetical protein